MQYFSQRTDLSVYLQAHPNKGARVSSTNNHVRPWDLKFQQKDLMQLLRRPVEPAAKSRHSRMQSFFCSKKPYWRRPTRQAGACSAREQAPRSNTGGFTSLPRSDTDERATQRICLRLANCERSPDRSKKIVWGDNQLCPVLSPNSVRLPQTAHIGT